VVLGDGNPLEAANVMAAREAFDELMNEADLRSKRRIAEASD